MVMEDEAHALFTDLVGGISGRLGDACIFSLHKMLPVDTGGMLMVSPENEALLCHGTDLVAGIPLPWEHDLAAIAARRRDNARSLFRLLQPLGDVLSPLWGEPEEGEVPQTYPVLLRNDSRDRIYFSMNDSGYGVVSLYHTLIQPIGIGEFPVSHSLSRRILNLPVHQDATAEMLGAMVAQLARCLHGSSMHRG
jgi:dTDP-4-amino-4,6-dideoxygalactose transaminase